MLSSSHTNILRVMLPCEMKTLSSNHVIKPNEKDNVIIQPDGDINVIIQLDYKSDIIIQPDDNRKGEFYHVIIQLITPSPGQCYVIIQTDENIYHHAAR
jgi:hypothetical protein